MVQFTAGTIRNSRFQLLATGEYTPSGNIDAAVIFYHGIAEYAERQIAELVTQLVGASIALHTLDHHGHGKSEPTVSEDRCLIKNFHDLIDDAELMIDLVAKRHPGVPIYLCGNSLGGLCAAHVAMRRQKDLAGLILIGAACDVEWTAVLKIQAAVGCCLACCMPRAQIVPAVKPEDLSQDPEVVAAFIADKACFHGDTRAVTAYECLQGFEALAAGQKKLTLPIYAIHGTSDKICSLLAVKRMLAQVASTDKVMYEVVGGYHELLMGPEKADVMLRITGWLCSHVAAWRAAHGAVSVAAVAAPGVDGVTAPEQVTLA